MRVEALYAVGFVASHTVMRARAQNTAKGCTKRVCEAEDADCRLVFRAGCVFKRDVQGDGNEHSEDGAANCGHWSTQVPCERGGGLDSRQRR